MPRKQTMAVKRKKIGFHILAAAVITIVFVGGNMFLLLSPLFPVSSKDNVSVIDRLLPAALPSRTVYVAKSLTKPFLFYDNKWYDYEEHPDGTASEYADEIVKNLIKQPVLSLPPNSDVLRSISSSDGSLMVFSVLTSANFNFLTKHAEPSGQSSDLVSVFAYNVNSKELWPLFTSNDLLIKDRYIFPKAISNNLDYISFDVLNCIECESAHAQTIVYHVSTNQMKVVGKVTGFSWLENGNYQYKEFIPVPCQGIEADTPTCYKDPEKLPWKKGSMK